MVSDKIWSIRTFFYQIKRQAKKKKKKKKNTFFRVMTEVHTQRVNIHIQRVKDYIDEQQRSCGRTGIIPEDTMKTLITNKFCHQNKKKKRVTMLGWM